MCRAGHRHYAASQRAKHRNSRLKVLSHRMGVATIERRERVHPPISGLDYFEAELLT